jgi:hypothetical protein
MFAEPFSGRMWVRFQNEEKWRTNFSYFYNSQFSFLRKEFERWKKIMQYPTRSLAKQQFNILSVEIPEGLVKFRMKQRKGMGLHFCVFLMASGCSHCLVHYTEIQRDRETTNFRTRVNYVNVLGHY